jgi:hypothetical protein
MIGPEESYSPWENVRKFLKLESKLIRQKTKDKKLNALDNLPSTQMT